MALKISILFYVKRTKTTKTNLLPIYLRITIDSSLYEVSTQRYIEASKWSAVSGRVKGNSEESRSINYYLDTLKSKAYSDYQQLIQEEKQINIHTFKEKWLGMAERPKMLLEIFQDHNNRLIQLVGQGYAPATLKRYKTEMCRKIRTVK